MESSNSPISSIESNEKSETLLLSIRNYALTLPRWQTKPYTEKILRQLTQEPKVFIERKSVVRHPENNHSVPDVPDIINDEGLTSDEDIIYITTPSEFKKVKTECPDFVKHNDDESIECELAKMFQDEPKIKKKRRPVTLTKHISAKKHETLKENLIRLFGSPLDDIAEPLVPKPENIKMENRRHSLPVSISIGSECLKPLRVCHKRKSEPDATTSCKMKKTHEATTSCKMKKNYEVTAIASTQVLYTEYRTASEFSVLPLYPATARRIETELHRATATKKPVTGETERVKVAKSVTAFIDLTVDDGISIEISKEVHEHVKGVVKRERESSEKAKAPLSNTLSMPLLSPVSPAIPAQVEAILPHDQSRVDGSSQRPPPAQNQSMVTEVTVQILQVDKPEAAKNKSQPKKKTFTEERPHTLAYRNIMPRVTHLPDQQKPTFQSAYADYQESIRRMEAWKKQQMVALATPNQTSAANSQTSGFQQQQVSPSGRNQQQSMFVQQQTVAPPRKQTTSVPQPVQQQQYTTPAPQPQQKSTNQWSQQKGNQAVYQQPVLSSFPQPAHTQQQRFSNTAQHVNSHIQGLANITQQEFSNITQQLYMQKQRLGNSTQPMNLPQLVQLLQPPIQFVSNAACADKIFPHLYKLIAWKKCACQFHEQTKVLFPANDAKDISLKFRLYCDTILQIFGKKLVKDLSTIDVQDFSIHFVLSALSTKLMEADASNNLYRVCCLVNLMIIGFETECNTPFLKKFYGAVKVCTERIEEVMMKRKEVPKFTGTQLQQLETQIRQYLLIQNWINIHGQNKGHRQTNVQAASPRISQQRQKNVETCSQTKTQQNTLTRINDLEIIPLTQAANNPQRVASNQNRNSNFGNISQAQNSTLEITLAKNQGNNCRTNSTPTNPQDSFRPIVIPLLKPQEVSKTCAAPKSPATSGKTGAQDNFNSVVTPVLQTKESSSDNSREAISGNDVPEKPKNVAEGGKSEPAQRLHNACNIPETAKSNSAELVEASVKNEIKDEAVDIIDLTWIDDADDEAIVEIIDCKTFPLKMEDCAESEAREVLSPTDSGLGSPVAQSDNDGFKCLCGNRATFVCACKSSMYCGSDCQERDWVYHQKLCHKMKS